VVELSFVMMGSRSIDRDPSGATGSAVYPFHHLEGWEGRLPACVFPATGLWREDVGGREPAMIDTNRTSYARILDEHREQRVQSERLRLLLDRPWPEAGETGAHIWAEDVGRQLVEVHDKLSTYYRDEETTGLFQSLAADFPQATVAVKELEGQHRQILRELREILSEALGLAETPTREGPELRARITSFLERLAGHEAAELELVQTLYLEDFGPLD
jgi:hypothetical protein